MYWKNVFNGFVILKPNYFVSLIEGANDSCDNYMKVPTVWPYVLKRVNLLNGWIKLVLIV